jgi:hypothetical protein
LPNGGLRAPGTARIAFFPGIPRFRRLALKGRKKPARLRRQAARGRAFLNRKTVKAKTVKAMKRKAGRCGKPS